jgi:hypothetical protein
MNRQQYKTIIAFQDKTFPEATPLSCINHLKEEIGELEESIEIGVLRKLEIADCFMLLFGICHTSGMKYEDIVSAIDLKHKINLKRKWGEINELGYVKHIPD